MELNFVLEEIEKCNTDEQRFLMNIIQKRLIKVQEQDKIREFDKNLKLKNIVKQKTIIIDEFNNLSYLTFNEWENELDKVYDEL